MSALRLVVLTVMALGLPVPSGVASQGTPAERLRGLVADLSSSDPARRGAALIALRDVHDPAIVPMLTQAVVSAQPPALDTIIEALALFPDRRKIPALIVLAHRFESSRNERIAAQFTPLGATGARALLDAVAVCGDVGDMHLAA
jgi:HEAT repeat protein